MTAPKPRIRLRVVEPAATTAPLTAADKLAAAIAYLRQRGRYVLDRGSPRPNWGIGGDVPAQKNPLLAKIEEMDRRKA